MNYHWQKGKVRESFRTCIDEHFKNYGAAFEKSTIDAVYCMVGKEVWFKIGKPGFSVVTGLDGHNYKVESGLISNVISSRERDAGLVIDSEYVELMGELEEEVPLVLASEL